MVDSSEDASSARISMDESATAAAENPNDVASAISDAAAASSQAAGGTAADAAPAINDGPGEAAAALMADIPASADDPISATAGGDENESTAIAAAAAAAQTSAEEGLTEHGSRPASASAYSLPTEKQQELDDSAAEPVGAAFAAQVMSATSAGATELPGTDESAAAAREGGTRGTSPAFDTNDGAADDVAADEATADDVVAAEDGAAEDVAADVAAEDVAADDVAAVVAAAAAAETAPLYSSRSLEDEQDATAARSQRSAGGTGNEAGGGDAGAGASGQWNDAAATTDESATGAASPSVAASQAGGVGKVAVPPPQPSRARSTAAAPLQPPKSVAPPAVKAAPAPAPPLPKHLTFYSWWYEDAECADVALRVSCDSEVGGGLTRRYVRVVYHLASRDFSIISESSEQALQMHRVLAVVSSAGGSVDQWDLHVGAKLGVMGRPIALMKADIETSLWHEQHARRLRTLREALVAELLKYKPSATSNAVKFERGAKGAAAGLSLRFTARQLDNLVAELNKYRPSRAAWYAAQLEIYH